jgi:hypothetical protein
MSGLLWGTIGRKLKREFYPMEEQGSNPQIALGRLKETPADFRFAERSGLL